ncbi:MAG: hypothetical protein D6806_13550, partial [Deltaproteobacteria bacterium]
MSWNYPLHPSIDLHVQGRIEEQDAQRQTVTARILLERLRDQPGIVLADEVGMGKTFVALAVAASVALEAHRRIGPVVVMAPPGVLEKWRRDAELFRERCLAPREAARFRIGTAERPVPFLKLLDDPPSRRRALVLVPHGLLTRRIRDPFTRFALVRHALLWSRDDGLRRAVVRHAPELLECKGLCIPRWLWEKLLAKSPARWLNVLHKAGYPPADGDDPVPEPVIEILHQLEFGALREALQQLPRHRSTSFPKRMQRARRALSDAMAEVWEVCLRELHLRLPLLVFDEAHHLRNAGNRIASLFATEEARHDAEAVSKGALAGVFDRMLFLTATPFQLGHHELCNVLDRFGGIRWDSRIAPSGGLQGHKEAIEALRRQLDAARLAAVGFEEAWGRLQPEDLEGSEEGNLEQWWTRIRTRPPENPVVKEVLAHHENAQARLREAEALLRKWVVRHTRPRLLPNSSIPRRRQISGALLVPEPPGEADIEASGLPITGKALLPFLLAGRIVALTPETRPVFAEGLASSYEAFLETRRQAEDDAEGVLDEDPSEHWGISDTRVAWYLERIEEAVRSGQQEGEGHPKLGPVVDLVMRLWEQGEKVLVFCHFVATGRALRHHVSARMRQRVQERAARALGWLPDDPEAELARIGRHFNPDRPARRAAAEIVREIVSGYSNLDDWREPIEDIVIRFLRTPTFLVRYMEDLRSFGPETVRAAFERQDGSGLSLRQLVEDFCRFLSERCGSEEREQYLLALDEIQTGSHVGRDVSLLFDEGETSGRVREQFVANVRLVNGKTRHAMRRRLMLAFNTPFYPEVLIASSVMAEGVDLQSNCRYVIHHDLSWNPSDLEQRTGRVDRIGCKAERAGQPIHVYFPYIAETQDEKMYRVVTDRARWFNVTMGSPVRPPTSEEVDRVSQRIPIP